MPEDAAPLVTFRLDEIADVLAETIAKELEPLHQRIAALEAKPQLRYLGTWKEGLVYNEGAVVTDHGAAWCCERQTTQRPGSGEADGWQLMVKKGRDGKDGPPGPRGPAGPAGAVVVPQ